MSIGKLGRMFIPVNGLFAVNGYPLARYVKKLPWQDPCQSGKTPFSGYFQRLRRVVGGNHLTRRVVGGETFYSTR